MLTPISSKSTVIRRRIIQSSQGEYNWAQLLQGEGEVDHDEENKS